MNLEPYVDLLTSEDMNDVELGVELAKNNLSSVELEELRKLIKALPIHLQTKRDYTNFNVKKDWAYSQVHRGLIHRRGYVYL